MLALTVTITFITAQFKKHLIKLFRDTYLIPPPSVVAGIFGAVMGIRRAYLKSFAEQNQIYTGAMLLSYEGIINEVASIIKIKNWKQFIRTPKKSVLLYKPTYKFAIYSPKNNVISELYDRLSNLDFEYAIFGGNDYNFMYNIGRPKRAEYLLSKEAYGYCRLAELESLGYMGKANIQIDLVNEEAVQRYVFAYGVTLKVREPHPTVGDDEHRIFVHPAWRFIR